MKKNLLILLTLLLCSKIKAQDLINIFWLSTESSRSDLYFNFTSDTLLYSNTLSGGYTPVSLFTDINHTLRLTDIDPSCPSTGSYTYVISGSSLVFSLINDSCTDRML